MRMGRMGHAYEGDEHLRKMLLVETKGWGWGSGWAREYSAFPLFTEG